VNYVTERERTRNDRTPSHRWYGLAAWRRLRAWVLSQPEHIICEWVEGGQRCREFSSDVDHKIPHRSNWTLFMDRSNLQGLCSHHHSLKTARENGGFGNPQK
jgi:5-methylcytosine-specific restriction protein A